MKREGKAWRRTAEDMEIKCHNVEKVSGWTDTG